jgi:hypothetical protein
VAVPAPVKTDPGQVLLFRGGVQVGEVTVGALPDMVTFTPDGRPLAVADEGEPNSDGQPERGGCVASRLSPSSCAWE